MILLGTPISSLNHHFKSNRSYNTYSIWQSMSTCCTNMSKVKRLSSNQITVVSFFLLFPCVLNSLILPVCLFCILCLSSFFFSSHAYRIIIIKKTYEYGTLFSENYLENCTIYSRAIKAHSLTVYTARKSQQMSLFRYQQ